MCGGRCSGDRSKCTNVQLSMTMMTKSTNSIEEGINEDDSTTSCLEYPSKEFESFDEACMVAADTNRKLLLHSDVTLSDVFRLRNKQRLSIEGQSPTTIIITGNLHSIFLLNNQSSLELRGITLMHTLTSPDHRDVGGAINLRYKSNVTMTDCRVISRSGFCCWAVQKSSMNLTKCQLEAHTRSAVVCFGQPLCKLSDCTISDSGVHAVCARGSCNVYLRNCYLQRSAVRALYAYAGAMVLLEGCNISGTSRSDHAAVEFSALESQPQQQQHQKQGTNSSCSASPTVTIKDCRFENNAGIGICIRGMLTHDLTGNVFINNGNDDVKFLTEMEEDTVELPVSDSHGTGKRDAKGSSYRMGDWWCPSCKPRTAIRENLSSCPYCESDRSTGTLLTPEEVTQCNRQNGPSLDGVPSWWYDGDSDEKGWVKYDEDSTQQLEVAFQRCYLDGATINQSMNEQDAIVTLSNGKYQVNVITRVQINVETQFPRLVRRLPGTGGVS